MVKHNVILTFLAFENEWIHFQIADPSGKIEAIYNKEDTRFLFKDKNHLTEVLTRNQHQLAKIVSSALKGKPVPGHPIPCLFIENFTFLNNCDYNHFIRVDRRELTPIISVSKEETRGIHKLYTDGSYASDLNRCGYAGMIIFPDGESTIYNASYSGGSSNAVELNAVLEGIKQLSDIDIIQINTDSRFVIRGLSQWIYFWKYNAWQMAYGRKVNNAEQWQELDRLTDGKFMELKWIKSHSGDRTQEFCHHLAKRMATEA